MTELIALPVKKRDAAGKGAARRIRAQGLVPGVIYGDKQPPLAFAIDPRPLMAQARRSGFYTHQYTLEFEDGSKHRVMAQDLQTHPVTDQPVHVDFLRINKDAAIHAEIPVHFAGQDKSPGLKRGGVLNVVAHEIEVIAKPDDLPDELVVDLSAADIGASIHVSTLTLPAGVKVASDKDFTVATIVAPAGGEKEEA